MNERTLTERYVELATAGLPQDRQADMQRELRANIRDMAEEHEQQGMAPQQAVEAALISLGDPQELAARYADRPLALISGDYYRSYLRVLKVALPLGGALYILFAVLAAFAGWYHKAAGEVNVPVGIVQLLAAILGAVTLVFAIMERAGTRLGLSAWSPAQLYREPPRKYRISQVSVAVGFVLALAFTLIALRMPAILDQLVQDGRIRVPEGWLPITGWNFLMMPILVIFALSAAAAIVKLLHPVWDRYTTAVQALADMGIWAMLMWALMGPALDTLRLGGQPLGTGTVNILRWGSAAVLTVLFAFSIAATLRRGLEAEKERRSSPA